MDDAKGVKRISRRSKDTTYLVWCTQLILINLWIVRETRVDNIRTEKKMIPAVGRV